MSDEAKSEKMKQPGPTTSESTVKSLKLQEIHQTHEGSKNELTKTLMAMRAMLESTADAILMTDGDKVTDFNQKYIDMWKVPREILEEGVARKVRQLMGENFADPQHFLARIEEIALIGEVSFDILELKDGRMVERHSQILTIDGQRAGRVWNYRDVTERHLADRGALVTGAQLDYNGRSAGYSRDPSEVINYISAHDNQTLFDNNQYKLPIGTGIGDRVRVNNLGLALIGLAQGIPFFHAGDDLLRSKSFDRNSYNSGDWFNRLDWTYQTNNFAVGLPSEWDNRADWPLMRLFLQNRAIKPGFDEIYAALLYFQDILRIRKSTTLFRLRTGVEVRERVKFHNVGAHQQPALIVMAILDRQEPTLDPAVKSVAVLFNVDKLQKTIILGDYIGVPLELHPVLGRSSADLVVKQARYESRSGSFTIPPRTTAVFVEWR
jgi:Domain of unknown function (DUF3372)/PAS domain